MPDPNTAPLRHPPGPPDQDDYPDWVKDIGRMTEDEIACRMREDEIAERKREND